MMLDNYIVELTTKLGKVTRNKPSTLGFARQIVGEKVTLISEEITYVGIDNVAYHQRILTQWMGDVQLLILATCPSVEWSRSQQSLNTFLDQVSIGELREQR